MYPPQNDPHRYSTEGHPASGIPNPNLAQPYAPPAPYINRLRSHSVGEKWSTGLCHCCDDPLNCLITCVCPCITFGQIAEIVNQGSPTCAETGAIYGLLLGTTGFACLYSCFYRSKMRGQYDLEESPCVDCLVHCCCETCALCQEYRELHNRGFDMGIGYEANMDRQKRGITASPIVAPGMTR